MLANLAGLNTKAVTAKYNRPPISTANPGDCKIRFMVDSIRVAGGLEQIVRAVHLHRQFVKILLLLTLHVAGVGAT